MTSITTTSIKRIINDIEKMEVDLRRIGSRATPDIIGFYGEMLAWNELKKHFGWRGYDISLGSGQSKADITMRKKDTRINIEVKTSRLKEEWHGTGFGYALNIKKCKKHPNVSLMHPKRGEIFGDFCYLDYIVAVLLSDDLKNKEFYVFPRSFINSNEEALRNKNPRFSSPSHRMIFLKNQKPSKEIANIDRWLVKNKDRFQNNWESIIKETSKS